MDRKANYTKYSEALHHILAGAKFIATNSDRLLETMDFSILGNGATVNMLEYASGVEVLK